MRKLQNQKNEKNRLENHKKFSQNFEAKNGAKISQKTSQKTPPTIRGNSRTMEWLQIPAIAQKEFRENLIAMQVDFMQYTCYKIIEPIKNLYNIVGFSWEIDSDNSNVQMAYNMNLSMTRNNTPRWYAYSIFFHSPWFAPVPVFSIEVYSDSNIKLLKTEGKIVFYGAYFVFREILAEEAPEILRFHNSIELWTLLKAQLETGIKHKIEKPIYKRTRIDIATDVAVTMSKKWLKSYIKPHKTSKHAIRPYNYDEITETFQSIAYIPRLTRWIWIRVYNKVLDIQKKNKQSWHPTYGTEIHPVVTRLEIVYGWDTAQESIENLIKYTQHKLLWTDQMKLKRKIQPKSKYSPLSAYEYFKRYAKNHGKSLKEVLDDVTCIAMIEEQKDMEYKENQYQEIEIFETDSKK